VGDDAADADWLTIEAIGGGQNGGGRRTGLRGGQLADCEEEKKEDDTVNDARYLMLVRISACASMRA